MQAKSLIELLNVARLFPNGFTSKRKIKIDDIPDTTVVSSVSDRWSISVLMKWIVLSVKHSALLSRCEKPSEYILEMGVFRGSNVCVYMNDICKNCKSRVY